MPEKACQSFSSSSPPRRDTHDTNWTSTYGDAKALVPPHIVVRPKPEGEVDLNVCERNCAQANLDCRHKDLFAQVLLRRRSPRPERITDALAAKLRDRVDLVLPVARGRAEMLSMHTATLGLIEALLVGVATKYPKETLACLRLLNAAREKVVGRPMDLSIAARRELDP